MFSAVSVCALAVSVIGPDAPALRLDALRPRNGHAACDRSPVYRQVKHLMTLPATAVHGCNAWLQESGKEQHLPVRVQE